MKWSRYTDSSGPSRDATDSELLEAWRRGDDEACEMLVDRYGARLKSFVRRILGDGVGAEDVVQDVFVRLMTSDSVCRDGASFSIWIFRVARNLSLDLLRRKKLGVEIEARDDVEDIGRTSQPSVADDVVRAELLDRFDEALATVPEPFRSAFLLREREGMSYEEIAAVLSVPAKTVSTRIHRARVHLRETLLRYMEGDAARRREMT